MINNSADRRRFLVIGASTGWGHIQAAVNLADALRSDGCEADVCDSLRFVPFGFGPIARFVWECASLHADWLYEKIYSFHTGRIRKSSLLKRVADVTAHAVSRSTAFRGVTDIIATHSFAAAVGTRLKVMHGCRLFVAATDFVLHCRHAEANADAYFAAPNSEIRGFATNKVIHPTGLPIRSEFFDRQNTSAARAEVGLDHRPVILVSFGGSGLRADRHINAIRQLSVARRDLQFVILTGRNRHFY